MTNIFDYICRHSTTKWATKFLLDLKHQREPPDLYHYEKKSFGTNWQIIKFKKRFKESLLSQVEYTSNQSIK